MNNHQVLTYILISLLLLVLTGCATDSTSLQKAASPEYFILENDISRKETVGMLGHKMEEGLKKGKYIATFEDKDGIYFQGEGISVFYMHEIVGMNHDSKGGIWIPKDKESDEPRLYYFVGSEAFADADRAGIIGIMVVLHDQGKIHFHRSFDDEEFMSNILIKK